MQMKTFGAVLILALLAVTAAAQKTTTSAVKSTIYDADAASAPYQIQSDLQGDYLNGISSVISTASTDWEMNALSSATRRVYVEFSDAVAPEAGKVPPASGWYPVRFLAQCSARSLSLVLMAATATIDCPMIVAIDVPTSTGTDRFSLRFNPMSSVGSFPGTEYSRWTCNTAASGKCTSWTGTGAVGGKSIANVVKVTTVKGKQVLDSYGLYRFGFRFGLTR